MTFEPAGNYFFRWLCPESQLIILMGLWDFVWWVYQEVNFSPRITQITLIFFRVNSRYSRLILARPCEIPKSHLDMC